MIVTTRSLEIIVTQDILLLEEAGKHDSSKVPRMIPYKDFRLKHSSVRRIAQEFLRTSLR